MANTFTAVQKSGPQDRGFGVIEIWMIGCSSCIFLAMIEYAIILLQLKKIHDVGCNLERKNKTKTKKCCQNYEYQNWDSWCLIIIPLIFIFFNAIFWGHVSNLDVETHLHI